MGTGLGHSGPGVSVTLHCGSLLIAGHPPRGGMLACSPAQELPHRSNAKHIPLRYSVLLRQFYFVFFYRVRFRNMKIIEKNNFSYVQVSFNYYCLKFSLMSIDKCNANDIIL